VFFSYTQLLPVFVTYMLGTEVLDLCLYVPEIETQAQELILFLIYVSSTDCNLKE